MLFVFSILSSNSRYHFVIKLEMLSLITSVKLYLPKIIVSYLSTKQMIVKDDIPLNKVVIYTEITKQIKAKGKFFLTAEC